MNAGPEYDVVVLGGGIAGLCIAEIFARSGWATVLIEKNSRLCCESSGAHHGWFHFGSLYSIFPNNQFMRTLVGGIDDLIAYYSDFPGMNVRVGTDGKLLFPASTGAWIRDDPMQYIVAARNDRDFTLNVYDGFVDYVRKLFFTLTWDLAIKQFISRHQRFHKFDWRSGAASENVPKAGWMDYSRDVIFKPNRAEFELDPDTHFRVPGFDRPMVPGNITADLMRSFLASGGLFVPNCEYRSTERRGDINIVSTQRGLFRGHVVVLATGAGLKEHIAGRATVSVVASPLLVAYPAVSNMNFARLTPFVSRTINHITHYANGSAYSVIGGGYAASADDREGIERIKSELIEAARPIFPKLAAAEFQQVYVSYKTEMAAEFGERNYQYLIRELGDDVYAVVPGKYSLGFSLAVNLYKKVARRGPAVRLRGALDCDVSALVSGMRHENAVGEYLAARGHVGPNVSHQHR